MKNYKLWGLLLYCMIPRYFGENFQLMPQIFNLYMNVLTGAFFYYINTALQVWILLWLLYSLLHPYSLAYLERRLSFASSLILLPNIILPLFGYLHLPVYIIILAISSTALFLWVWYKYLFAIFAKEIFNCS